MQSAKDRDLHTYIFQLTLVIAEFLFSSTRILRVYNSNLIRLNIEFVQDPTFLSHRVWLIERGSSHCLAVFPDRRKEKGPKWRPPSQRVWRWVGLPLLTPFYSPIPFLLRFTTRKNVSRRSQGCHWSNPTPCGHSFKVWRLPPLFMNENRPAIQRRPRKGRASIYPPPEALAGLVPVQALRRTWALQHWQVCPVHNVIYYSCLSFLCPSGFFL